jgi:hypothetical protein
LAQVPHTLIATDPTDALSYTPCVDGLNEQQQSPQTDDYQPCASSEYVNFPFLAHAGAEVRNVAAF